MAVEVRVYTSRIDAINAPGGMVHGWSRRVIDRAERIAVDTCPKRTGEMTAMHYTALQGNQHGTTAILGNRAPYAQFVHDGTRSFITSNRGPNKFMRVRPFPHSFYPAPRLRRVVQGQRAQPWLAEALDIALRVAGIR